MTSKKNHSNHPDNDSQKIIGRAERESEAIGASSLARSAEKTRDHFLAKGADQSDPVEVWGTRIGRALSLIFVAGLMIYLYNTYLS